jgi:hypothetical protein
MPPKLGRRLRMSRDRDNENPTVHGGSINMTKTMILLQAELKSKRNEALFYRRLLIQIATRKRKTIEQQLAQSGLDFYDCTIAEAKKKAHA